MTGHPALLGGTRGHGAVCVWDTRGVALGDRGHPQQMGDTRHPWGVTAGDTHSRWVTSGNTGPPGGTRGHVSPAPALCDTPRDTDPLPGVTPSS